MQLYVDPTELAGHSCLPTVVAALAKPLPQLEARTGADLLLSILDIPISSDLLLQRHCTSGLLVQLKRHNDLQSSITTEQRLFHQLYKMKQWCERCWLVVTGVLLSSEQHAVIGEVGRETVSAGGFVQTQVAGRQGIHYNAVSAALDAYAYYGGYVRFIPTDEQLLP